MMPPLSPLRSAPPAWRWRFQGASRRAGVLALSLTLGLLTYAPTSVAQSEPGILSRFFTARALRRVGPAVVRIDSVRIEHIRGRPSSGPDLERQASDPFFERFFNQQPDQKELGAGVIFTEEGLILTTAQTVNKMDYHLDVHLTDSRTLPGKLVGVDFLADLAVVRVVAPPPFPIAPLGNSDTLEVGDRVRAIGKHSSATENTVAIGSVVSNRNSQDTTAKQQELIQTDVAIDHHHAGGPLVNSAGEVIGINTLVRNGEPTDHRGFAVPINAARAIAEELVRTGLSHPTVGARVRSLTPALAREFNQSVDNTGFQLPERHGLLILHVRPRGPAAQVGLRAGDVVLTAAGNKVASPGELFQAVASTGMGGRLRLGIWRQRQEQQVTVMPEEMAQQIDRAMRDTVTPLPSPSLNLPFPSP